jgi:hypothetical protein
MIYIDSPRSWNIDIDGYCEAEALRITAERLVAKLFLRKLWYSLTKSSAKRSPIAEARLGREAIFKQAPRAGLVPGHARLE